VDGSDAEHVSTVVERPMRSVDPATDASASAVAATGGDRRVWLGLSVLATALVVAIGFWWSTGGTSGDASRGGEPRGDEREAAAVEDRPTTTRSATDSGMPSLATERVSPEDRPGETDVERSGEAESRATAERRSSSAPAASQGVRGERPVRDRGAREAAEQRRTDERAEPGATSGVVVDMTATWDWGN
jgi:hypothetical protein